MKEPNFFIIGAPKCGTTSMATWLSEHPNVYMSPMKEPHFYCTDFHVNVTPGPQEYTRLFKKAGAQHSAVGEASTSYLLSKEAVPQIENEHPGSHYIVLVRNPVEMAYSLYDEWLFLQFENLEEFETAWRMSPERRQGRGATRWCPEPSWLDYQTFCRLGEQVERLFTVVPPQRILILLLDDLREDARREYHKVLSFLGLPDDKRSTFPTQNPAKQRLSTPLHKGILLVGSTSHTVKRLLGISPNRGTGILQAINSQNVRYRSRPSLSAEFRQELTDYFHSDVIKLAHLMDRDLSSWLSHPNTNLNQYTKGGGTNNVSG